MKNSLDIHISYNRLESLNFIQRFATAYAYLEGKSEPDSFSIAPGGEAGHCVGCSGDLCGKNDADKIRCAFFFLFNTMTGNSAIRCHFDGRPTEMQKLVGDGERDGNGCGSDFVADFLYGYTGYEYRICADPAGFKDEIIASIDAGKPVIARLKANASDVRDGGKGSLSSSAEGDAGGVDGVSDEAESDANAYGAGDSACNPGAARFHLISGYDGDALLCPDFKLTRWNFEKNGPDDLGPEAPPAYEDIEALYVFGDKTERRYTLKDGLLNIRKAIENNTAEKVLDGYIEMFGGWDAYPSVCGLDAAGPQERRARALRLQRTVVYFYNICSLNGAFNCDGKLTGHYLHKELFDPAFAGLWDKINGPHDVILNSGHKMGGFHNRDWDATDVSELVSLSAGICDVITGVKKADEKLLQIVNAAVAML